MINTHEVNLRTSEFNKFKDNDFFILENKNYEVGDFVLFKEVEAYDLEIKETGAHRITRIKDIITDEGLKPGYVLLILEKL